MATVAMTTHGYDSYGIAQFVTRGLEPLLEPLGFALYCYDDDL